MLCSNLESVQSFHLPALYCPVMQFGRVAERVCENTGGLPARDN